MRTYSSAANMMDAFLTWRFLPCPTNLKEFEEMLVQYEALEKEAGIKMTPQHKAMELLVRVPREVMVAIVGTNITDKTIDYDSVVALTKNYMAIRSANSMQINTVQAKQGGKDRQKPSETNVNVINKQRRNLPDYSIFKGHISYSELKPLTVNNIAVPLSSKETMVGINHNEIEMWGLLAVKAQIPCDDLCTDPFRCNVIVSENDNRAAKIKEYKVVFSKPEPGERRTTGVEVEIAIKDGHGPISRAPYHLLAKEQGELK
ncbi:hypothetical protein IWW36_004826 [Coemansia brasiliensis]|uniref:Uncharacterized protein n=1 Tax=Coemansia brasiliensis TaxID=2650707 RepID=A0A9W8I2R4_9FUNG|nr:hypothetical protein IWW36_004826 [Coemansia brasiliensis]